MMYRQIVARRYARGLMLCVKPQVSEDLLRELKTLKDLFLDAKSDLARLFEDPAFSPIDRKKVLDEIANKLKMDEVLHRFLLLLIKKDRMPLLPMIHDSFLALLDEAKGRVRAKIKSATPLSESEVLAIKEALASLSNKVIVAQTSLEKDLIGGVRVEMDGIIFDGTARARLDALKHKLFDQIGNYKG